MAKYKKGDRVLWLGEVVGDPCNVRATVEEVRGSRSLSSWLYGIRLDGDVYTRGACEEQLAPIPSAKYKNGDRVRCSLDGMREEGTVVQVHERQGDGLGCWACRVWLDLRGTVFTYPEYELAPLEEP